MYKIGAQNKQFFHFPKSAEKRWIEVLDTSGILHKMSSHKIILQVLKKLNFIDVPSPSVVRSKFAVS
jgi:hypothetical protein